MQFANVLPTISTANIADAHDHLGMVCKWLSRELGPTSRARFWGLADVVQWGPTRKAKDIRGPSASTWDEVKAFIEGLTVSPVPRVYVAGCREVSRDYVLLGGMSLTQLHMLKYAGAVVNGIIRDHEEVSALGMPVWSAGLGVMDSQGCMKVETRGGQCTVNSHPVFQDDLIVGDGNGVVAIGHEVADVILDRAQEIARIENQVLEQLRAGRDLLALVTDGGHI